MKNLEIRTAIMLSGLKHWQVADELGLIDASFSRMLRKELPLAKKQEVMKAIDAAKKEYAK